MNQDLPSKLDRDCLCQLSSEELVEKIIEQAIVIQQLQAGLEELKQEIERLRVSRDIDSKTSSKPPSGDLLKKPETKKPETDSVADSPNENQEENQDTREKPVRVLVAWTDAKYFDQKYVLVVVTRNLPPLQ